MKCKDCGGDIGVYSPPAPGYPEGRLGHYCYAQPSCCAPGRYISQVPVTAEEHALVAASVAESRENARRHANDEKP